MSNEEQRETSDRKPEEVSPGGELGRNMNTLSLKVEAWVRGLRENQRELTAQVNRLAANVVEPGEVIKQVTALRSDPDAGHSGAQSAPPQIV